MFIGIDVSKGRLDVAVCPSGERDSVFNDEGGIQALIKRLGEIQPTLIVMEATGGFEHPAMRALASAELPVVVVNPRQVRDFAKATGQLAKTDRIDAGSVALRKLSEKVSKLTSAGWRPSLSAPTKIWTKLSVKARSGKKTKTCSGAFLASVRSLVVR
jgi:hypothetical protein